VEVRDREGVDGRVLDDELEYTVVVQLLLDHGCSPLAL
jgi:hypothetical protein